MRDKEQSPQGEQTFHMRTGLPPVRGKEKTPPPTKEEANAANTGVYAGETKVVEKVGGNRVLKAVLGGSAVVAGGAIAYEAVPAVHRAVDSSFLDNIKGRLFSSEPSINPNVFDSTAIKGVIKPAMIVRLPQEEIDRQFPTAFGKLTDEGKTIISLSQPLPSREMAERVGTLADISFEVGEDKNTLQFQYPLDLRSSSNPNTQIQFTKSYGGMTQTDYNAFKNQGYYDTYHFYNIPKGTIIKAPVDGFFVTDKNHGVTSPDNPNDSAAGFIDFQDQSGTTYRVIITGENGKDILVFKSLVDAPEFNYEQHKKPIKDYGAPVKKGQAIFQTNSKLDTAGFKMMGTIKYKEGERIYLPTNVELIHSPDNQLITSDK